MKLKSLLLYGGMLAVTSTQAALTVEQRKLVLDAPAQTTMPFDGTTAVYLYNPASQGFLLGANNWNTRASYSTTSGYKWKITVEDPSSNLVSLQDSVEFNNDGKPCTWGWRKMFADNANSIWVDNNNGANANAWSLTLVEGNIYKISNTAADATGTFLAPDENATTVSLLPDGESAKWYAVTPEAYETTIKGRADKVAMFNASELLWDALVKADAQGVPSLSAFEAVYADETSSVELLEKTTTDVMNAIKAHMASQATATAPADFTSLIVNPTFDKVGDFTGWSGDKFGAGGNSGPCAEHYNKNYNTYQTLKDMPNGVYAVSVDGYYRPGDALTNFKNGTAQNALLYAENVKAGENVKNDTLTTPIYNIFATITPNDNSISTKEVGETVDGADTYYTPNSMAAAVDYMEAGKYKGKVVFFAVSEGTAKIGVKKTVKEGTDWSIFDNFGLKYYGTSADAYTLWNKTMVENTVSYDPETTLVTNSVLDEYNAVKAAKANGTTYDEVMANIAAINAASEVVNANINAWNAYKSLLEKAQQIAGDPSYEGPDVDALTDYVEFESADIILAELLTTDELALETTKLQGLYDNAVNNSIKPNTDVTNYIVNADFSKGKQGWNFQSVSGGTVTANASAKCAEAWNNGNFDIHQVITTAPVGVYKVSVQGFYRRGRGDNAWKFYFDESTGEKLPNVPETPAYVYLNSSKTPLANVFEYKVAEMDNYYTGNYYTDAFGYVFPNDMTDAGLAFDHGAYEISTTGIVANKGDEMRIGMKGNTTQEGDSWAIFTRFKLIYMGYDVATLTPALTDNIKAVDLTQAMGTEVKAQAQLFLDEGNAALATNDGKTMFKALANILAYNDSIAKSVALFSKLSTNVDDIMLALENSMADGTVKTEAAVLVSDIQSAMASYTNAQANAALDKLAEARYKLSLPAGYENATDAAPVDLTSLIKTPGFEKEGVNSLEGWENTKGASFGNNSTQKAALCIEFYEKDFDMYQDIVLPNGTYQVSVQAFDRLTNASTDYDAYANNVESLGQLYVQTGTKELYKAIEHLASDNNASSEQLGISAETTYTNKDGVTFYAPNDVVATRAYFDQGRYVNGINVKVENGKLRIGVRSKTHKGGSWVILDDFKLTYLGTASSKAEEGWNDIKGVETVGETKTVGIYSVDGAKQNSYQNGVNIVVTSDANGNVNAKRVLIKK